MQLMEVPSIDLLDTEQEIDSKIDPVADGTKAPSATYYLKKGDKK